MADALIRLRIPDAKKLGVAKGIARSREIQRDTGETIDEFIERFVIHTLKQIELRERVYAAGEQQDIDDGLVTVDP